jgi:hypothetical protein
VGKLYEERVSAQAASVAERREAWNKARASFQRSLHLWRKMGEQGPLNPMDAAKVEAVSKDIAKCSSSMVE